MADRRLLAALALSVLIHATVAGGPGWRLPFADEEPETAPLQAQLAARPAAAAAPAPKPAVRKPAARKRAAPKPAAPVREVVPVAPVATGQPPLETAPVTPPAPAGEEQAAVPAWEAGAPEQERGEIAWPRQGRIRFVVTRGEGEQGLQLGESEHSWSHDGAHYSLQTVAETTGLVALFRPVKVAQLSEGEIGGEGLVPREFRVERNGKPAESARFDRETMRVVLMSAGAVRREAPLAAGSQDLLSQVYQLGLVGVAARLELMIATGKNYGRYVFEAAGEERLATRFGELRTWHLRTPAMPGEQATEVWLASDYHNLPVRIRHIDRKGDLYDQTAVEMEIDGTRLAEGAQ